MFASKFAAIALAVAVGLCALTPAAARAEVLSIEEHLTVEAGSTTEWTTWP
jgi:hypothetical protein